MATYDADEEVFILGLNEVDFSIPATLPGTNTPVPENSGIIGNALANTLTGDTTNNYFYGGGGADILKGGQGDDLYEVHNEGVTIVEQANEGADDTVWTTISYTLGANVENLRLMVANNGMADINGTGNDLSNKIHGNFGNNIINGKAGADIMDGADGNDTYYVDNASDIVEEAFGSGNDQVFTTVSYALSAATYIEKLFASGSSSISLTGNGLANTLTGNGGRNTLKGGAGHDTLDGGSGSDKLYGSTGKDVFVFSSKLKSSNVEMIKDYSKKDDSIYLENKIFSKLTKTGTLKSKYFCKGAKAQDSTDLVGYDNETGKLWYDSNGDKSGGYKLIARMAEGLKLGASEFKVI